MQTTLLTIDDIKKIIQSVGLDRLMREMIDQLDHAFRQYDDSRMIVPTRDGFSYDDIYPGLLEWMPVMTRGENATIKIVGYHPCNPSTQQLPTIVSTVSVYDVANGHLIGLMDGVLLTALRTGAASALASRYLAKADSKRVGLIGAGAQAVTQLHGLAQVFDIERVQVYDIDPTVSATFADRVAFMDIPVEVIGQHHREQMVSEVDILCTATSAAVGSGAVFDAVETAPHLHINAVGSDFPGKIEVPLSLLERAFVSPDFPAQAAKEGECQQLPPDRMGPPLYDIIRNPSAYAEQRDNLTVFDSTGWAVEDAVASQLLLDYADELKLGQQITLESLAGDPQNPYNFLT